MSSQVNIFHLDYVLKLRIYLSLNDTVCLVRSFREEVNVKILGRFFLKNLLEARVFVHAATLGNFFKM